MNKCKLLGLSLLLVSAFAAAADWSHYTTGGSLRGMQNKLEHERQLREGTLAAPKAPADIWRKLDEDARKKGKGPVAPGLSTQVRSPEEEEGDMDSFVAKERERLRLKSAGSIRE